MAGLSFCGGYPFAEADREATRKQGRDGLRDGVSGSQLFWLRGEKENRRAGSRQNPGSTRKGRPNGNQSRGVGRCSNAFVSKSVCPQKMGEASFWFPF